jgi:hypothetical protein
VKCLTACVVYLSKRGRFAYSINSEDRSANLEEDLYARPLHNTTLERKETSYALFASADVLPLHIQKRAYTKGKC